MLLHRNDGACQAKGFYTYDAFVAAAGAFPGFGTTGSTDTRKREVAAFLAQTSHETTGGWATAPDGAFAWGYCFKQERGATSNYCTPSAQWPCAPGKSYYGRGPIQLSQDRAAGRVPGFGVITNIINGGIECGHGQDSRVADRIGFYKRYCDILRVGYGDNLDCYNQRPFA
ncbi:unnamed protein product [Triticum turgidum subsp. durum]|uniref:chitinase n=1 Tax=Triticum turgidum subsp. durum TaxID=4567 RepID=A0A9R1ADT4_TRITD|nr:unnamed protein product [Triticum turgidum subsp. durum]